MSWWLRITGIGFYAGINRNDSGRFKLHIADMIKTGAIAVIYKPQLGIVDQNLFDSQCFHFWVKSRYKVYYIKNKNHRFCALFDVFPPSRKFHWKENKFNSSERWKKADGYCNPGGIELKILCYYWFSVLRIIQEKGNVSIFQNSQCHEDIRPANIGMTQV